MCLNDTSNRMKDKLFEQFYINQLIHIQQILNLLFIFDDNDINVNTK